MQFRSFCTLVLLICTAVIFAGCTGNPASPGAGSSPGSSGDAMQAQNNLVPSPTDVVPDTNQISVIVQEKVYDASIPVVFDGGRGLYLAKSAKVTLYRADGQVRTYDLGVKKGDTVSLDGTRQTDRVVVTVTEMNGQTYKVADVLSPYRTR